MSAQLPQQRLTVPGDVDEEAFYSHDDGSETLVTHADLEEAVPNEEKPHLKEIQRYWVNKPYAFVVIYRNVRDNELRYISVEPRLTKLERDVVNFFRDKLQTSINYDEIDVDATPGERSDILREETLGLMKRYNLLGQDEEIRGEDEELGERIKQFIIDFLEQQADKADSEGAVSDEAPTPRDPETGDVKTLNATQVRRVLYYLVRDYIRFDRIDPIKHDVSVEEISENGYNSPIFVYHSEYGEHIVTNIEFGEDNLDSFVKTLAQSAGKGISRRQPSVDATLADGSRAQLTLGTETSDKGTNFTIRQFNDIPFTPIDLINWKTFSINQMAYIWMAIENNKSIVFAGGTASGKTTTLNAVSLFMPSTSKIVSIEDTRELEIPQANWLSRKTREAFQEGGTGTIDEFDLLEDALRQRPDYVIMGEVRGEEGETLFQMLNTGHTTYTTFHANKPKEVIRRFTTDPINVSPSMFDALDIICQQESIDIEGTSVRRVTEIVEVNDYNASANQFSLNDAFGWDRNTDTFDKKGKSNVLERIRKENAWEEKEMRKEWNYRRLVLAYLVKNNINTYAGVAATLQGYMSSKDTVLGLIADDELRRRIAALHQMKTINIDTDSDKEALIPRPNTPPEVIEEVNEILNETESVLTGYDSSQVDFAQTIESMIRDDQSGDSNTPMNQIESGPTPTEQLPEGDEVDEEITDSNSMSPMGTEAGFEEDLKEIFDDDDEEEEEDLILTSENLQRLNETEEDNEDTDESDIGDVDEFLNNIEEEIEEEIEESDTDDAVDDDQEILSEIDEMVDEDNETEGDEVDIVDADDSTESDEESGLWGDKTEEDENGSSDENEHDDNENNNGGE